MKAMLEPAPDLRAEFNSSEACVSTDNLQCYHRSLHAVGRVCGSLVKIFDNRSGAPEDHDGLAEHFEVKDIPFNEPGQRSGPDASMALLTQFSAEIPVPKPLSGPGPVEQVANDGDASRSWRKRTATGASSPSYDR